MTAPEPAPPPSSDDSDAAARPSIREEIAAIEAGLREHPLTVIEPRLRAARAAWPRDLKLCLLDGEWNEKTGQLVQAEACYQEAQTNHPNNPWPAVRLVGLLLAMNRPSEAQMIFTDRIWRSDLPEAIRSGLLSRVTASYTDLDHRRQFLNGLLDGRTDDRFVHLKLAAIGVRQRDRAAAQRSFDTASQLGPLPVESELLQVELLLSMARFDEAFARARTLVDRFPGRPDFIRRAIQTAHLANRKSDVEALLGQALGRWPGDWLLLFRYNRALCSAAADLELFRLLEAHERAAAHDHRWLFQFAVACLRQNQTERAIDLLDRCLPDSPVSHMAAPLRAALAILPVASWGRARGVTNDPAKDVQVVQVPDARATVVVMAGAQGGLGYLPPSHVSAVLADFPVNVVLLSDLNNRGFTAGVRSFGDDQASLIAGLRTMQAALDNLPIVALGASLGGVAAIRVAVQMQAHAAISFAGPIQLGAYSTQEGEGPAANASTRNTIAAAVRQDDLSLVEMVRDTPGTMIYQCYGSGYEPDVAAATLLKGLPNAVLVPVEDCADHFVIEHMLARGSFAETLTHAMEGGQS